VSASIGRVPCSVWHRQAVGFLRILSQDLQRLAQTGCRISAHLVARFKAAQTGCRISAHLVARFTTFGTDRLQDFCASCRKIYSVWHRQAAGFQRILSQDLQRLAQTGCRISAHLVSRFTAFGTDRLQDFCASCRKIYSVWHRQAVRFLRILSQDLQSTML